MKVQASSSVGFRIPPRMYKQSTTTLQHESAADLRHPLLNLVTQLRGERGHTSHSSRT